MEAETQSKKIEEAVMAILKDSDLEEATEFKVRTMAAERLGLDLSGLDRKCLVRRVVESYLLSLEDEKVEEQTKEVVQEQGAKLRVDAKEASDDGCRIICKLAGMRGVAVHDFKGTRLVSFRDYYKKDGKLLPSAKGISLNVEQWLAFRKGVPKIEAAILKMESQIRSKDSEKQLEADVSNSVTAVAQRLAPVETRQTEVCISKSMLVSDSHEQHAKEIKQIEADLSSSLTASAPQGLSTIEAKPVISNSAIVSACAPHGFTPMETKQAEAYISDAAAASASPGVTPTVTKCGEADIASSVIALASQGFTSAVTKPIDADICTAVASTPEQINPFATKQIDTYISSSVAASGSAGLIPMQTPRLNGKNYHCWMHLMEFFLIQLKVSYVLTEPCPSDSKNPEAISEEIAQAKATRQRWVDDDYVCRHIILNSLSDHLFDQYSKQPKSAKELWEELKLAYDEDFGTKRSHVNKYIQFQMVDGISILVQAQELHKIANSIIASGMWIDENFHVSTIISKLPPSWKEYGMKLMQEDFLPLNMLMHRLKVEEESRNCVRREESLRKAQVGESRSEYKLEPKRKDFKRPRMIHEIEDNKAIVCYNCGKKRHISRNCPHRKAENKEKRNDNEVVPAVTEATLMEGLVQ